MSFPNHIKVLTDKTIDSFINSNEECVVLFHANWCSHCVSLKPEFIKAGSPVRCQVAIGVIEDEELKKNKKYVIKGYPTIRKFRNGKPVGDYNGERVAQKLMMFMIKKDCTS